MRVRDGAPQAAGTGEALDVSGGAGDGYDAVILAGGRAERLGGRDKPGMLVGGRSLVERVAAAVPDAARLVVVGPRRAEPARAVFTREDPPGSGPIPALRAALPEVSAPWVALLAGDMPFLRPAHVAALLRAARAAGTGAVLVDAEGHPQWLAGMWAVPRLARALDAYRGRSLRGLLGPLEPVMVHPPADPSGMAAWFDCDTMDDLQRAREALAAAGNGDPMNVLAEWTARICQELGIDPERVDRDRILDLTKEVAHGVARPAAPLTAYLLGLAEGAGTAPADAIERITRLAREWQREN